MKSYIVVFQPDGICVEAGAGKTLLEVAREARVVIDSACGGQGTCGRCKVQILLGQPGGSAGDLLSPEELQQRMVLACQATVADDLVVEVPSASQWDDLQILTTTAPGAADDGTPLAQRVSLSLAPPTPDRNYADADRLLAALHDARPQPGPVGVDLEALRTLPEVARAHHWQVEAMLGDFDGEGRVLEVGAPSSEPAYGLAVDVGTTTVVTSLVDLETGGVVGSCAYLNDQITYGADVISRIIYGQEHDDGRAQLQEAAVRSVERCLESAREEHGVPPERIIAAACAGNTVMTHLLLGLDPAGIRRDPYVPVAREFPTLRAHETGLGIHPRAPVYLAPCVSSYVGGDISAGVLAAGLADSPRLTLFVDLGTNGEMVVGNEEWLACCSCSAGPAFEGSGIEYGMYATRGAIERVDYDCGSDRVLYHTIGDAKPRGICGSGLVDALAALLRAGVVDRAGRIDLGFRSPRVRVREERPEFVLVWGEEVGREDDISLGEDDIENLLRAKAAVYAGITTLLESLGLEPSALERVLVAGGFGNYLDAENAVTIGVLPDLPLERVQFVGNTSLAGAALLLLSGRARRRVAELAGQMTNFELSTMPDYMDRYVASLFLPHTDLSQFPSVTPRLEQRR